MVRLEYFLRSSRVSATWLWMAAIVSAMCDNNNMVRGYQCYKLDISYMLSREYWVT